MKLPNPNGRIYPNDVLKNAVKQCQKKIDAGRLYVAKRCPDCTIETIDVIGIIKKLTIQDSGLYGDIEFLDTPAYQEFYETVKNIPNIDLTEAFSSVGIGQVKDNVVSDDFEIIGAYFI